MNIWDSPLHQNMLKNIVKTRILTSLKRALTYCREYFLWKYIFLHPFQKFYTISCSITVSWTEIYCCIVKRWKQAGTFFTVWFFLHFNTATKNIKRDLKYGLVYRDDIKIYFFGLIGMEFLCENFNFLYLQHLKVLENWHDLFYSFEWVVDCNVDLFNQID